MSIDITIIDKYIIDKNKQFHQFDETACFAYKFAPIKIAESTPRLVVIRICRKIRDYLNPAALILWDYPIP